MFALQFDDVPTAALQPANEPAERLPVILPPPVPGRDTGFRLENFLIRPRRDRAASGDPNAMYCSGCGSPRVSLGAVDRDTVERLVCGDCGRVHYRNPRVVVRCIGEHDGRVLLCQRADEPRRGYWSLPGGYLENGETLHVAAVRETREEAGAVLEWPRLRFVYEMPQLNEVVMVVAARVGEPTLQPGHESLAVELFDYDALPWCQLAFPTDFEALWHHSGRSRECAPHGVRTAEFHWGRDGRIVVQE